MKKTVKNSIAILLVTMLYAMTLQASVDETVGAVEPAAKTTIDYFDVDIMIDEFKATLQDTVELVLFRPIGFTATIKELPYSRKHSYLKRAIQRFASESPIVATKGITVASSTGRTLPVYIIDELADGMNEHLKLDDSVIFEAYHVYNSRFGPGLLVYSWEKQSEPNRFTQWWNKVTDLFAEKKADEHTDTPSITDLELGL